MYVCMYVYMHVCVYLLSSGRTVIGEEECGGDVEGEADGGDEVGGDPQGNSLHQPAPEWLQERLQEGFTLTAVPVLLQPLQLLP